MKKSNPFAFLSLRNAKVKTTQVSLTNHIVLITGATSGIGLAAAERFAKGGAELILLIRNEPKAKDLQKKLITTYGVKVHYYLADFSDLTSLKRVLMHIQNHHPKIDILINNAGIYSTKKIITPSGFELGLTVNHLASFMVTDMLAVCVQNSQQKRIIQVNSEGHRFSGFPLKDPNFSKRLYTGLRSYGTSKTAQLLTVWELAKIYLSKGIMINAVHPGEVKSNIGLNNGWLYRTFKKLIINRLLKRVDDSAEALYYLAAAPELATTTGKYFHLTTLSEPATHAQPSPYAFQVLEWTKKIIQSL
jgi:retinol dehydrogenase 13